MKTSPKPLRRLVARSWPLRFSLVALISCAHAEEVPKDKTTADSSKARPAATGDLVPLKLKLPPPAFKGTPKDLQLNSYVAPLSDKARPPMMVPAGLKNIAPGKKL